MVEVFSGFISAHNTVLFTQLLRKNYGQMAELVIFHLSRIVFRPTYQSEGYGARLGLTP